MKKENNFLSCIFKKRFLLMVCMIVGLLICKKSSWGEPLRAEASGRPVSFESCLLEGDQVVMILNTGQLPSSDDDLFYIYSNEVFQDGPTGEIAATVPMTKQATVSFPLQYNTPQSHLSRKFLVAVKSQGKMIQVSNEHYLTNPEVMAAYTLVPIPAGIKGILGDGELRDGQLQELGVDQVVYNMLLDELCVLEGTPEAIPFGYNGQIYYFNGLRVAAYDSTLRYLNQLGIKVTMVLLNTGTGEYGKHLVHPKASEGDCPGYALNVEEKEAVDHLKAIAAFLGQRYSGATGNGQVDNWILGNEVNARTSWWYTDSPSLEFNVSIYVKAFRIFYNEIKAMNGNAAIYNSLDQEWNRKSNPGSFLSKDYLDRFNYYMRREGNIDWGLSFHPYNSPLYDPYAWNGPSVWVKDSLTTPYITMQNLDILIDYMKRPEFLSPSGEVRSISLAEIGYTSSFGSEAQEASIAYAYLKAASHPEIDAFLLFRRRDNEEEMKSYLAMGLCDLYGNRKQAYEIYKNLGTPMEGIAKERASAIIGMNIDEMIANKILWTREGSGVVELP